MTAINTKAALARKVKEVKAAHKAAGKLNEWGYYPVTVKGKDVEIVIRAGDLTVEYRDANKTRVYKDSLFN